MTDQAELMPCGQGRAETTAERIARAPRVLRAYIRDLERYGKPLDSGLPDLLEFVAAYLEAHP